MEEKEKQESAVKENAARMKEETEEAEADKIYFLRQVIGWAEVLKKPACRRRRERNWKSR